MYRSTMILVAVAAIASPAGAADQSAWNWNGGGESAPDFRTAYPVEPGDWMGLGDTDDPVHFETGIRYWYSLGAQRVDDYGSNDAAHTGELHLRVDDYSTNSFAKALLGYSAKIDGSYDTPSSTGSVAGGQIGYAGGDFGWYAAGDQNGSGVGPSIGYLYWDNSPATARAAFTTQAVGTPVSFDPNTGRTFLPFDSVDDRLNIHALRLGVQGKLKLAEWIDLDGELIGVPYAKVGGVVGGHGYADAFTPRGNIAVTKASSTAIDGWGYGGMGQLMVGFHPTENLAIRLGGRAWYVQGVADLTYSEATIGDPSDSDPATSPNFDTAPSFSRQNYLIKNAPFSVLRYGLLAEMTYKF